MKLDLPVIRARGVPTVVVSAVTEKGIVRGISHFTSEKEIYVEVIKAVGVLNPDGIEWSTCTYHTPRYVDNLVGGGFSGWHIPSGIYLFPWLDVKDWRDPEHRYSSPNGRFLWRPIGWAEGRTRS